jgi:hypothetical protein
MKDKLALLNERRVALGKPALKSWKGSKAKLEEAITALGHAPTTESKPAPAPKPLPRIARSMGIDPKAARAALRKIHGAAWKQLTEEELRAALTPA